MKIYDDYQAFTKSVAVYPSTFDGHVFRYYLPLGIADEAGELAEKIDEYVFGNANKPTRLSIVKEIGDVLWYCTRFLDEHGLRLSDFVGGPYAGRATLDGLAAHVCMHAGLIAGRAKKYIRDASKWTDVEWNDNISSQLKSIRSIIAALTLMARFFDTNIEHVMHENQHKLLDRKERGALQGNGDTR